MLLVWGPISFWILKTKGLNYCLITAPSLYLLAPVFMSTRLSKSGYASSTYFAIIFFDFVNRLLFHRGPSKFNACGYQFNSFLDCVWPYGPHVHVVTYLSDKPTYLLFVCWGSHLYHGLDFFAVGFTPSYITQKPKYSISGYPKNDFSTLNFSPFSYSLISACSRFSKWLVQSLAINTNRPLRYAQIFPKTWNSLFIFPWKNVQGVAYPHR